MKRWGLRHRGFRVGFIGVVVCSIFYVVGFAAPAWKNTMGLWMSCSSSHKMCVTHSSHTSSMIPAAWFEAVRALECLSLISILLCVAAEVYMDFLSNPSPDRRLVELLALIGGTCGLMGCIIFAVYTPLPSGRMAHYEVYLSWGFGLATASSCFLIAFSSVIAYFRRKGLDVANYAASNAVHYSASDGMVVPQGFNGMDLGPPAYNEVVNQSSGGGQGTSGSGPPSDPSQFGYYKPPSPDDSQPPPAYYPPPPSGQFEAPPPYTIVPSSALSSGLPSSDQHATESGSMPVFPDGMTSEPGQTTTSQAPLSMENSATDNSAPDTASLPVSSGMSQVMAANPAMPSVPAYYVTVLGQMVPVFREELQQAGRDVPAAGAPVPAYFIVTQGQHVPVYSEEQARALTN
ncbi:uncharacterized protein LOC143292955 [Babylonia areolata]|uniref:uncharacterized protein LOC143292955 n=1 Tax=Babylonia areolata TaxID=304850 RepID=UPI003FD53157